MNQSNQYYDCHHYALLSLTGEQSQKMLQSILSSDLTKLEPLNWQFSALCSHQGRVLSLFKVLKISNHHLNIQLPKSLVESIQTELKKYAQFSKVEVQDVTNQYQQIILFNPKNKLQLAQGRHFKNNINGLDFDIYLSNEQKIPKMELMDSDQYHSTLIENGIAEIEAATSEKFIAQMIDLEKIGALSYTKGCYIGQEVIARLHYKGRLTKKIKSYSLSELDLSNADDLKIGEIVSDNQGNKIGTLLQKTNKTLQLVVRI